MEVTKKIGSLTITFEGETQKDIVKQLSSLEEVFGESACGKCGSENLRWVVRENDGNEYYELRCLDCGAKLAFGVNKKGGGLFPKRKDGEGNWLPDKGWTKWNNKTKQVE
jgi:DNA-directed RNA polymerase subunit RPC12/RpoP